MYTNRLYSNRSQSFQSVLADFKNILQEFNSKKSTLTKAEEDEILDSILLRAIKYNPLEFNFVCQLFSIDIAQRFAANSQSKNTSLSRSLLLETLKLNNFSLVSHFLDKGIFASLSENDIEEVKTYCLNWEQIMDNVHYNAEALHRFNFKETPELSCLKKILENLVEYYNSTKDSSTSSIYAMPNETNNLMSP